MHAAEPWKEDKENGSMGGMTSSADMAEDKLAGRTELLAELPFAGHALPVPFEFVAGEACSCAEHAQLLHVAVVAGVVVVVVVAQQVQVQGIHKAEAWQQPFLGERCGRHCRQ